MHDQERILASGVFDLFHVGHLRYLQYARAQGGSLVVGVLEDEMVWRLKAKYPAIPLAQRMELIRGLACVDEVRVQPTSTRDVQEASQWIPAWGVTKVVVGGMWRGDSAWVTLQALLQPQGISVSYAPATAGISSTAIAEQLRGGSALSSLAKGHGQAGVERGGGVGDMSLEHGMVVAAAALQGVR